MLDIPFKSYEFVKYDDIIIGSYWRDLLASNPFFLLYNIFCAYV